MIDPWRDKPMKKRPEGERKFSLKNPVDRTLFFIIGGIALALIVIIVILLVLFLPDLLKK